MYARVAVIERQCLFVMFEGLVEVVAGLVDIAEVVPAVCQFRVKQDGLLAMLEGLFVAVQ